MVDQSRAIRIGIKHFDPKNSIFIHMDIYATDNIISNSKIDVLTVVKGNETVIKS